MDVPKWREAASVIIATETRDGRYEVCMVKRSINSRLFPGQYVFPGGSLDPSDEVAGHFDTLSGDNSNALKACAIREVFEESGISLSDHSNDGSTDLIPMCTWITPIELASTIKGGFENTFFFAKVHRDVKASGGPDGVETNEVVWISPGSDVYINTIMRLLPMPQLYIMTELSNCPRVDQLEDYVRTLHRGIFRYPFQPFKIPINQQEFAYVLPGDQSHDKYRALSGYAWEHRSIFRISNSGEIHFAFRRSPGLVEVARKSAETNSEWCVKAKLTDSRLYLGGYG
jgi:8-oxo-dGTP pyrophosphatase MutT (NUDIX family)